MSTRRNSMASVSSSFSSAFYQENEKPDLESIRVLVISIKNYILGFIRNAESWHSLKKNCTSKLNIQSQEFFEFSDHSILSNLYWGIDSIESAIKTNWPEEKNLRLSNSERLLQVPALLDEHEVTGGIPNFYLVSCSYFYLSVVKTLQEDDLQAGLHFLQALSVFPRLIGTELAPELCVSLFPSCTMSKLQELVDFGEGNVSESIRQMARRYKHWLMYYQVLLYGGGEHGGYRDVSLYDVETQCFMHEISSGTESFNSTELQHSFRTYCNHAKVYPLDPREDVTDGITDEFEAYKEVTEIEDYCKALKYYDQIPRLPLHDTGLGRNSSIRCLQDMLKEPQSDRFSSCYTDFEEESDFEEGNGTRKNQASRGRERLEPKSGLLELIEESISSLCFSEGLKKCDKDYAIEVTTIYELLNSKTGVKYAMLKDVILEQLLTAISTSEEDTVIRASVSILITIISANESVVEEIKKKGLPLLELARALKRNVQEAAILIHLIKPSPTEIKTLELLPTLVEVVCNSNVYKGKLESVPLTPPAASLMIIEVLVTSFDYATNNTHLAAINSPNVLCGLLGVARHQNLEELISLATVLVKCMQFDGQCRKYLSQFTPLAPLIFLLQSNEKRATTIALEFFHELLRIPRSSAIRLLQRVRKEGSINIMQTLLLSLQQLQPDYQLLAANLLLQLDTLENSPGKSVFREEAVKVLLNSLASEESSTAQILSSSILSNIGGTFSWTGEPYTVAWLAKKAGLTSFCHQNMIRNFDWLDQSLQDTGIDSWCSKVGKSIIEIGKPVFQAIEKGLTSKIRSVSQDSLTALAWLGCEIAKSPNTLRFSACEIILDGVEQFLHPGVELEERLLACLCIYNYASGKGMQKVIHFSEGVRESLRRFSNVTWMAEELHKVADYYLPNKSRISCVHTQILEARHKYSGAVTALIYYKGLLYSGYSDGSIKVWDIKGKSAILVWDIKEHRKALTCFSLFEPGESLLSGSADKTIRVWQMVQRKLELIEVIETKEPIQKLNTYGQMIFAITSRHRMKVYDSSRTAKDIYKNKNIKSMNIVQGRIYVGCMDSSIQELTMINNQEREIKAPSKSWRFQSKSINSIVVYRDWLYSASSIVEGSNIKERRRQCKPQVSFLPEKGTNILAMGVVEDFIYLNCSYSSSSLQIWLRGTQQKVGRISAGSKITSFLTANDIVLCGTETGLIKGWIPL